LLKKFLISMSLVLAFGLFSQMPLAELSTTTYAASYGWKQVNGTWYYYYSNGTKATGWKSISGKWYYFDSSGVMKTGWVYSGSKWYYLNTDGSMATGWKKVSNSWYYLDGSGAMKTDWIQLNGKWYFLKSNGVMQTSWAKIAGKWYFFDVNGVMKTGWVQYNSEWYFLNSNGSMKTGWLSSGGKWYYLDEADGFMWTGWVDVNGKLYFFYDNGVMASNTTIDGITLGSDGAAIEGTGFFDVNIKSTIGKIITYHNNRSNIKIEADYEDANDVVYFFGNGEPLAYAEEGIVIGDPQFAEFMADITLALGAPTSVEELETLLLKATSNGEAHSELVSVYNDGTTLEFYWDTEY
jgi:hypothetical protein